MYRLWTSFSVIMAAIVVLRRVRPHFTQDEHIPPQSSPHSTLQLPRLYQTRIPKTSDKNSQPTTDKMPLSELPNEVLTKIFKDLQDVHSMLNLAGSCKHMHEVYMLQNVDIQHAVSAAQYGPFEEAVQIVTYIHPEPAHIRHSPPISEALIKQVAKVGNTANDWLKLYPELRWSKDFINRRSLNPEQAFKFRRALYRFWLYGLAFHEDQLYSPSLFTLVNSNDDRYRYISFFSNAEIIDCAEVHELIYLFARERICPSHSIVQREYSALNPNAEPLSFDGCDSGFMYDRWTYNRHDMALEARLASTSWGPDSDLGGVLAEMMKLNPARMLELADIPNRKQRQLFISALGWVEGHVASFRAALQRVMLERGESLEHIEDYEGWAGILITEE